MNTKELSKKIKENPELSAELLSNFRTDDWDLRNFLFSLKTVDPLIVPALIDTFTYEQEKVKSYKLIDLVKTGTVGTLFELNSGGSYIWTGFSKEGNPTFVKFGDNTQEDLDLNVGIKWLF